MRKNIIVAMASLAFLPAVSFAAAPTLTEVLDASGVSLTGHLAGSYTYLHQDGGDSLNTFEFDQARLQISKLPASGFGGLVDVYVGQDVAGTTLNFPGGFNAFGDNGNQFNLHQAYVSYSTGSLTVIGGKFATLAGYEVAPDGSNLNATRSLLFKLQPFTHTGVRAAYKLSDMATFYAGASNSAFGATTDLGVDDQKTVELGVALAPAKGLTINVTDYLGTEANTKINLLDAVVAYSAGDLSLGLNADYFTTKVGGFKDSISGVALYAGYQLAPVVRVAVRAEVVDDKDDAADTKDRTSEVTLTAGYTAAKNFEVLADVGRYWFNPDGAGGSTQAAVGMLKAVYKF